MKLIKISPLLLTTLVILLGVASGFAKPATTEAAQCYMPQAVFENGVQTGRTQIVRLTNGCTYQEWSNAGLNISGLPNPFPAGNGVCYFFPINQNGGSASVVNCSDPQYANAPEAFQPGSGPNANDGIIGTQDEAKDFCETLGGSTRGPSDAQETCWVKNPTSQTECTNLSHGDLAVCVPLTLASMIGKTEQQVRAAMAAAVASSTASARIKDNPIVTKVLKPIITTLTALVGLVIVISIIIAGIQYSAARDNAQMVAAAKMRILMAIVSLLIFIFGFAVLQWLVPGGVL